MGKEGATVDNMDPSCPFLVLEKYDRKKSYEVWWPIFTILLSVSVFP
jgi:hypothetical protein